jgi:hypothetical protein
MCALARALSLPPSLRPPAPLTHTVSLTHAPLFCVSPFYPRRHSIHDINIITSTTAASTSSHPRRRHQHHHIHDGGINIITSTTAAGAGDDDLDLEAELYVPHIHPHPLLRVGVQPQQHPSTAHPPLLRASVLVQNAFECVCVADESVGHRASEVLRHVTHLHARTVVTSKRTGSRTCTNASNTRHGHEHANASWFTHPTVPHLRTSNVTPHCCCTQRLRM